MHFNKPVWVMAGLVLGAAGLSSCNIGIAAAPTTDVSGIYTAAAQTLVSQFSEQQTQTAQAAPPTSADTPTALVPFTPQPTFSLSTPGGTPFVFNTPAAGTALPTLSTGGTGSTTSNTAVGCDDSAYWAQSVPDGTTFHTKQKFEVGFQMNNTGTCSWGKGYSFDFVAGKNLSGNNIIITIADRVTAPGNSNTFVLSLQAPDAAGQYKSSWQMKNPKGALFGSQVFIIINVK